MYSPTLEKNAEHNAKVALGIFDFMAIISAGISFLIIYGWTHCCLNEEKFKSYLL